MQDIASAWAWMKTETEFSSDNPGTTKMFQNSAQALKAHHQCLLWALGCRLLTLVFVFTMDFAPLVTEKGLRSSCGSFLFSGRSQCWCHWAACLFAPLPGRRLLVPGFGGSKSSFTSTVPWLQSSPQKLSSSLFSHQWGLSGPHHSTKTQREAHMWPTVDHGPGARVFVELLHYSCCSARCLDSTAIGRLMGFRWEINGASFLQKCISVRITTLWGIITLTQSIWRKIRQQFFGIKHVDFWFYIIYAFLKVVIIQISQDYLFLWNFPLWRISTFWGFVLNWNENKFQNLKVVCETQFPFSGQLKFQARTCIIAPLQGIPLGKNVSEWIQWCKRTVFRICPSLQGGGGATENFPK